MYIANMFIRKKTHKNRKTGNQYFTFQLIESVRTERGPRQHILLNLGSDLSLSASDSKLLANRIEERLAGIQPLLPYPEHIERLAGIYSKQLIRKKTDKSLPPSECIQPQGTDGKRTYHSVDLDSLEHEHCRSIGIEYIAYETFKKLGLKDLLSNLGFTSRQIQIATAVIVGRLVHPASERSTHYWLKNQTALDELMDTDFSRLALKSVYQAGDNLLKHKELIEEHLATTEQELFALDDTVFFYDLTNTYFGGASQNISLATRGRSKERRSDSPLVTLGLVVGSEGFPKSSKIFPGNVSEPSTLKNALQKVSSKGSKKPVVVLDAGIATEENLEYLRNNGYAYIVSSRSRSCEIPKDLKMETVKETEGNLVRAAKVSQTDKGEIYLYCESEARRKKEESMRSLLQERFEADLAKIVGALQKKGGTKNYPKVLERIGRLKEKHKRVAHYYDIDVEADANKLNAVTITWRLEKQRLKERFQGTYLLRIYGLDWGTDQLWHTYMMLTEVEEAFRCLKTDLGLRPAFHQIDRRVEAHLFITVLAYHIMQTILYQLRLGGMSVRWATIQQILSTQVRVTSNMRTEDGRQVRIRSTSIAEADQQAIYRMLNLQLRPGGRSKTFI